MPAGHDDDERRREADEALRRVARESGSFGHSHLEDLLGRAGRHFSAADADPSDRIEVWGRRIGRALSAIAVVALLFYLLGLLSPDAGK